MTVDDVALYGGLSCVIVALLASLYEDIQHRRGYYTNTDFVLLCYFGLVFAFMFVVALWPK